MKPDIRPIDRSELQRESFERIVKDLRKRLKTCDLRGLMFLVWHDDGVESWHSAGLDTLQMLGMLSRAEYNLHTQESVELEDDEDGAS